MRSTAMPNAISQNAHKVYAMKLTIPAQAIPAGSNLPNKIPIANVMPVHASQGLKDGDFNIVNPGKMVHRAVNK